MNQLDREEQELLDSVEAGEWHCYISAEHG